MTSRDVDCASAPDSPPSFTIGIGTTLSGQAPDLGVEMQHAAQLAIEECNAEGGVCGARVVAAVSDDAGTHEQAEAVARAFCARSDVLGVIGHYRSDVSLAAAPIYDAHELPMITPVASNPTLTEQGWAHVFRWTNRDDRTGIAIAGYLYTHLRKQHAVVVETDSAYGRSMADAFARAFMAHGGRVLDRHTVKEGEREFGGLIRALPGANAYDLLFYGGSFEGAAILKALRARDHHQLFAAGDGCWDVRHFLEPAGDAAMAGEGVLVLSASLAIGSVPGSREFAGHYTQRYGAIGNYALNAYDATRLLLNAIGAATTARGGVPTRQAVTDAIRRSRYQGAAYAEPVAWNSHGDNLSSATALHIVSAGRFVQVAVIASRR